MCPLSSYLISLNVRFCPLLKRYDEWTYRLLGLVQGKEEMHTELYTVLAANLLRLRS